MRRHTAISGALRAVNLPIASTITKCKVAAACKSIPGISYMYWGASGSHISDQSAAYKLGSQPHLVVAAAVASRGHKHIALLQDNGSSLVRPPACYMSASAQVVIAVQSTGHRSYLICAICHQSPLELILNVHMSRCDTTGHSTRHQNVNQFWGAQRVELMPL